MIGNSFQIHVQRKLLFPRRTVTPRLQCVPDNMKHPRFTLDQVYSA